MHRLPVSLALGYLLAVIDSFFAFVADLVYGDHVQSVVEPAVAGQRESVTHHLPAGDLHGGDPGVGGEVALGRKPSDVPDQGDDLRGQYGAYAEDVSEGGARGLHLFADTSVEIGDPPVEGAHVAQELGSQLPTDRLGGRTRITSRTNSPEDAGRPVD